MLPFEWRAVLIFFEKKHQIVEVIFGARSRFSTQIESFFPRQGILPKDKRTTGNVFWRRTSLWCSNQRSSSKTPTIWFYASFFWKKKSLKKIGASKNEMSGIIWNAFWQSLKPIGPMLEGLTAVRRFEKNWNSRIDFRKRNVRYKNWYPGTGSYVTLRRLSVVDASLFRFALLVWFISIPSAGPTKHEGNFAALASESV